MTGKKSHMILIITVLCILLSFTGCGFRNTILKSRKNVRVMGATYMTMNNPYFIAMNSKISEIVEANGDILISRDPENDQSKQNEEIQDMLDKNISALFLNPVDIDGVKPALEACKKAGVPVFNIDTEVSESDLVVTSVLSDNYDAGVQIAKDMMERRTSARIIVLDSPSMGSIRARVQGFRDTIAGKEQYRIIDTRHTYGLLEESMSEMNRIISSGESFNVVFGGNDPTALGALASLQMNHISENAIIYGIDGSPDGKAMIKQKYLTGSSAQSPLQMAQTSVDMAYQYLNGSEIRTKVLIPVTLINIDNIAQFDITGWQ